MFSVFRSITDKTLSRELRSRESDKLINGYLYDCFAPKVEYSITEHGAPLEKVLDEMHFWELLHRSKVLGDSK